MCLRSLARAGHHHHGNPTTAMTFQQLCTRRYSGDYLSSIGVFPSPSRRRLRKRVVITSSSAFKISRLPHWLPPATGQDPSLYLPAMKTQIVLTLVYLILPLALCLASTDSISDADPAQSGYLPNHNMNPTVVNSSAFKILWNNTFNANEVVCTLKGIWRNGGG